MFVIRRTARPTVDINTTGPRLGCVRGENTLTHAYKQKLPRCGWQVWCTTWHGRRGLFAAMTALQPRVQMHVSTILWGQRVHSCVISTQSLYLLYCVGQYMHTKRHHRHTGRDGDKTSLFEDTGESTEASSCRPIAPCSFGGMDARNSAETRLRGKQEGM